GKALVEALAGPKRLQDPHLLAGALGGVELVLPVPWRARILAATDGEEAQRERQCDRSCGASHPSPPGVSFPRKVPCVLRQSPGFSQPGGGASESAPGSGAPRGSVLPLRP